MISITAEYAIELAPVQYGAAKHKQVWRESRPL